MRDVNLSIEPGEFFGLFGPNGAGKTTLIRILTTLIIPSHGSAAIHGHDVVRSASQARALIGLVFSNENSFYGRLTGRQNLEFFAALQNLAGPAARRQIDSLFDLFQLTPAANTPFQFYSTGMRQKLNVARALLHSPPVLFLDEPTKGMDILTAETLRSLLREELVQRQRKTVLLTTHDLQEMEALCDRVGILDAGTIRAVGAPAALIAEASASVVYRLELALAPDDDAAGLAAQLAMLPGIRACQLVTQSPASLVLDLGLDENAATEAGLWAALSARGLRVRRYAPKDDGLVSVLKQSLAAAP